MIGVVLAGGRSTRLGQDKVRLRLPGDGRDMLARTADLLAACTDGVVISCRAPDAGEETLALPGIRSIPDAEPGLGPLGGVWSALRELRQPILVLSCDLPFMDMPTLRRLIDARGARPPEALMTTFQQAETGFIEALVSIYEPACLPFFEEARARNLRQLNLVIPEKLHSRVVYTRAEALPFFNINFPGELEQAKSMIDELDVSSEEGGVKRAMRVVQVKKLLPHLAGVSSGLSWQDACLNRATVYKQGCHALGEGLIEKKRHESSIPHASCNIGPGGRHRSPGRCDTKVPWRSQYEPPQARTNE